MIKPAEYDYAALVLNTASTKMILKACTSACFMCHVVAEKYLKAGMYVAWEKI